MSYRPDGREICSATNDGQIYIWDSYGGALKGTIDGKRDALGGRRKNDGTPLENLTILVTIFFLVRASKNSTDSMAFTSLCYRFFFFFLSLPLFSCSF